MRACPAFLAASTLDKERAIKKLSSVKQRLADREETENRLATVLREASRAERARKVPGSKRREAGYLDRFLGVRSNHVFAVRAAEEFRCRHYSEGRRVVAYVDHLFVRFPVPLFLYRSVLSHAGLHVVFEPGRAAKTGSGEPAEAAFRSWFFAVARGESFAKCAKDTFTKKEAHWFLQAPATNTIQANVLWARAVAMGVPFDGSDHVVARYDAADLKRIGDRLPELLRFYAENWRTMRGHEHAEITDYLRAAFADRRFSLKGRTYKSVRRLCLDWHRASYSGYLHEYRSWDAQYPAWELRQNKYLVRAQELTSNRLLADEGARQRHCVLSYTFRCIQGSSRIVSLRWFGRAEGSAVGGEAGRLTLEISPGRHEIVQIRGVLNRRPTDEEMNVVRRWAGDHGLTIGRYA